MWIPRYVLPIAVVLSLLFACLAPKASEAAATIPAKELLQLAQRAGGRSYTYSQGTARDLVHVMVPRPAEAAGLEELEGALEAAGFTLLAVGPPERQVYRVERAGG